MNIKWQNKPSSETNDCRLPTTPPALPKPISIWSRRILVPHLELLFFSHTLYRVARSFCPWRSRHVIKLRHDFKTLWPVKRKQVLQLGMMPVLNALYSLAAVANRNQSLFGNHILVSEHTPRQLTDSWSQLTYRKYRRVFRHVPVLSHVLRRIHKISKSDH
jgi:hypothetical protein